MDRRKILMKMLEDFPIEDVEGSLLKDLIEIEDIGEQLLTDLNKIIEREI